MQTPPTRAQASAIAGISAAFGALLTWAVPIPLSGTLHGRVPARALIASLLALLLFLASAAILSALPRRPARGAGNAPGFPAFFLPCAAAWMLYLLAFYPALMTGDSVEQWRQIVFLRFNDRNPPFHTLLIWLVTRAWRSPAAVALFQIASLAAAAACALRAAGSRGAPRPVLVAALLFYCLWPLNGFLAVTLWKDIPYSACVLWLTALLARIADGRGEWLSRPRNAAALAAALALVCLLRHNGAVPAAVSAAGAILVCRGGRRWAAAAAAGGACAAVIAANLAMYRLLPVAVHRVPLDWVGVHQIAGVISGGGEVTGDEYAFLTRLGPRCFWRRPPEGFYHRYDYTDLVDNNPDFDEAYLALHTAEFRRVWREIIRRNPRIAVDNWLAVTSLVWRITQPPDGYTFAVTTKVWDNPYGISLSPKLPRLSRLLSRLAAALYEPRFVWLFYRPAIALYACVFLLLLRAVRTGGPGPLLVSLPVVCTAATLMIGFCQDSRLLFSAVLCAPFAAAYLAASPEAPLP